MLIFFTLLLVRDNLETLPQAKRHTSYLSQPLVVLKIQSSVKKEVCNFTQNLKCIVLHTVFDFTHKVFLKSNFTHTTKSIILHSV